MRVRESLGQQLIREGLISNAQLQAALSAQLQFDGRLGTNLIELGYVSEEQLTSALGRQQRVASAEAAELVAPAKSVLLRLPARAAGTLRAVPLRFDPDRNNCLRVAMADPSNLRVVDDLTVMLGCPVVPLAIAELRLGQLLEKHYGVARPVRAFVRVVSDDNELYAAEAQGYASAPYDHKAPDAPKTKPKEQTRKQQNPVATGELRLLTPPPLPPAGLHEVARGGTPKPAPTPASDSAKGAARVRPALEDVLAATATRASGSARPAGVQRLTEWWLTTSTLRQNGDTALAPVGELEFDPGALDLHAAIRLTLAPGYSPAVETRSAGRVDAGSDNEFDLCAETELVSAGVSHGASAPLTTDFERAFAHRVPSDRAKTFEVRTPPTSAAPPAALGRAVRPRHSLKQALEQLSVTDDRDVAAHRVLSYLEQSFACALILVVRQGVAYGWKGFASGASEEQIESLVVPLNTPSLFQQAFTMGQPSRGAPSEKGERIHGRLWKLLQCERPSEVLIAPVHVESRVVNLIYAHPDANRRLRPVAQSHLVQLGSALGLAYRRAIRRGAGAALTLAALSV